MEQDLSNIKRDLKEVVNLNTDCESCKLVGVAGLTFIGCFLLQQRNNFGKVNAIFQSGLGGGILLLAVMRAFDIPPFGSYVYKEKPKK